MMEDREFRQEFNSDQVRCKIALALRNERERAGLTQIEVAERAALTQSQIARAENPDRGMTLDQLVKVADGLGLVLKITFEPANQ